MVLRFRRLYGKIHGQGGSSVFIIDMIWACESTSKGVYIEFILARIL